MWSRSAGQRGILGGFARPRGTTFRLWLWLLVVAVAVPAIGIGARKIVGDPRAIPPAFNRYPNLVSLDLEPAYLAELLIGARNRGRDWERPGRVTFYKFGVRQFESPVGIRIHGGVSRYRTTRQQSLRLIFRRALDATRPPGAAVGLDVQPQHHVLILHGDERHEDNEPEWHYVSPVAYDIARRLGVLTPEVRPITLVLNGSERLPYVATEYLSLDYLEARFGHDDFDWYGYRVSEGMPRPGPVGELTTRYGPPARWTLEQVESVVDVDGLTGWFLTVLLCGSKDITQGRIVRDRTRPGAKWFWIAWDFDNSFGRTDPPADPWHFDQFPDFLGDEHPNEPRFVILKALMQGSEPYRRRLVQRFVAARDSLLTPAFVDSTLSRYEAAARLNGIADTSYQPRIREYLRRRPAIVREQLIKYLHVDVPGVE